MSQIYLWLSLVRQLSSSGTGALFLDLEFGLLELFFADTWRYSEAKWPAQKLKYISAIQRADRPARPAFKFKAGSDRQDCLTFYRI
jgi:hypothetical protein